MGCRDRIVEPYTPREIEIRDFIQVVGAWVAIALLFAGALWLVAMLG